MNLSFNMVYGSHLPKLKENFFQIPGHNIWIWVLSYESFGSENNRASSCVDHKSYFIGHSFPQN